jgi:protein TonB
MSKMSQQEKKNNRIAFATSAAIHVLLFVAFLFAVAWRAPDPPLPEVGIELNFGTDDQGSGDVQPETPVGKPEATEEQQQVKNDQPAEDDQPVSAEPKPQESKPVEQPVVSKQESPVTVKEPKKEESKPVETQKEKTPEKPVETKEPVKKDPNAEYKPTTSKTTADNNQAKSGTTGSQGDDANKAGDKGDPKGSLDANALYGKPGGGDGGSSLNLAGWEWDEVPKPDVPNNESGRIVFEIKVDQNGEIVSIVTKERSVSLEAEKICRKEIEQLTFTKTGANVPNISTGTITFVVRSH